MPLSRHCILNFVTIICFEVYTVTIRIRTANMFFVGIGLSNQNHLKKGQHFTVDRHERCKNSHREGLLVLSALFV